MKANSRARPVARWTIAAFALAVLATLSFQAFLGCGNNPLDSTVVPAGPTSYDIEGGLAAVQFADSLRTRSAGGAALSSPSPSSDLYLVDSAYSEAVFNRNGGTLTLQLDNEKIPFVIPGNALSAEVQIKICGWKYSVPDGYVYLYQCAPPGLVFAEPIKVTHPVLNLSNGEYSGLFHSDDSSHTWSFELASPAVDGWAIFDIHHFSMYGVSDLRAGP